MKRLLLLTIVTLLFSTGCGYRLSGRGRNLPPGAKTIVIPNFKNQTSRPQAEQFVTFAVRDEFIKRSRLRLSEGLANADLFLEGTIVDFTVTPVSYSEEGAANIYQVRLILNVRLIDMRNNETFFQKNWQSYQETYETDTDDFFSQETKSLTKIASKFASSIVASILENF
jgi:TolB-like protein